MNRMSRRLTMLIAVCGAVGAAPAIDAQTDGSLRVTGTVFDSLARRPLAGALVELARIADGNIGSAKASTSDSSGRFDFPAVTAGRYIIVFRHAVLDTLGLESREQTISVDASTGPIRLATPSPTTVMRTLCPSLASADSSDSTAFLTGHLYDGARDAVVGEAIVAVGWQVPRVEGKRLAWQEQTVTARTSAAGWFAICAVPGNAVIHVQAARGVDSTGLVDVRIPPGTIRHVSLYLSSSVAGAIGRITGRVRDAANRPLPRVTVVLPGKERVATTDAEGTFKLDSVPDGTQSLEFRAIGFAPLDTVVRVSYERPLNVAIVLERATVLEPIVSTASGNARSLAIFEMHRKSSAGGHFIRPVRLEGYPSLQTIHTLVQGLPGTPSRIEASHPIIFVDGVRSIMSFTEIDAGMDPDDIVGVEVYTSQVPGDYPLMPGKKNGIVIAIWTKAGPKFSQPGRP